MECHFVDYEHSGLVIDFPHPIHLPNVRRLFVSSSQLSFLRLPSLDNLMNCSTNASDSVHDVFSVMNEFIYGSHRSLTRFSIHNPVSFYQIFIEDYLLLMDSLVSLEIGLLEDEKAMFDALASISVTADSELHGAIIMEPISRHMITSRSQYLRSI